MQHSEKRLEIVDVLRGWALLIVVVCNYTGFAYNEKGMIQGKGIISEIIQTFEEIFFSAKGWSLLFVLFGFGFGYFTKNDRKISDSIIIKRMLILFVFAIINSLIYDGDILRDYTFLGLILILFYRLSTKKLAIIGLIMFLIIPFLSAYINKSDTTFVDNQIKLIENLRYSYNVLDVFKYNFWSSYYYEIINLGYSITAHFVMFICMLVGIVLQKTNFFVDLKSHHKKIKTTAIITFFFSIFTSLILFYSFKNKLNYLNYFSLYYWIVLSTMIFTASSICLLYLNKKCKNLFNSFSIIGKMTLTNYMMQNFIGLFIFQGIGLRLFHTMPYYFYFLFAILVYTIQVYMSKWWLKNYKYGPVEFIWRKLSKHNSQKDIVLKKN